MASKSYMKYVKLIAKPDTWFKTGTEAYEYNCDWENRQRVTELKWNEMIRDNCYCLRGIRIKKYDSEDNSSTQIGEEYFDGECGYPDEFEATVVDEPV